MPAETGVDDYLGQFDGTVRTRLDRMRSLITDEAPDAVEALSYGLVGYKLDGRPLVYVGGYAKHIGFYATPNGHEEFATEFSSFKQGKGSVQLPHTADLPEDLVRRVVRFRVEAIRDARPGPS